MMCFRKKKTIGEIYIEDRKCVLLSAQEIDVLIALDKKNFYKARLEEIKDQLLYLSPRDNKEVYEIDKKIRDKIGDLKLVLNKHEEDEDESVISIMDNIFVMISERNAKEIR